MTFEELQSLWAEDAKIDKKRLADESLNIPMLHSKWYRMYIAEKISLMGLKNQHVELEDILEQYYARTLTAEELKSYGLEYDDKKILKTDIPKRIMANKDNIKLKTKIGVQNEKVDFIKSILAHITGRSYIIKDAIEFIKFEAGG